MPCDVYVSGPIGNAGCKVPLETSGELKPSGGLREAKENVLDNVFGVADIIQKSSRQPQQIIAVHLIDA
jgi:hypothetical protein